MRPPNFISCAHYCSKIMYYGNKSFFLKAGHRGSNIGSNIDVT